MLNVAVCGCERAFIFIDLLSLFRCSQKTLRFSAPMLAKMKAPNMNNFLVAENF